MGVDPRGLLLAWTQAANPIMRLRPKSATILYQPVLDVRAGTSVGFQALAQRRERHGENVAVDRDPAFSLDLLKEALPQVAEHFRKWQKQGLPLPQVSFTLDEESANHEILASLVEHVWHSRGLDPGLLEFVFPESLATAVPDRASAQFVALQELNASVSLQLVSYGRDAAIERARLFGMVGVHVDVSRLVADDAARQCAVETITAARDAGLVVTGNRVGSLAELELLVPLGCDRMQGFVAREGLEANALAAELSRRQPPAEPGEPASTERRSALRLPVLLFPDRAERTLVDVEETAPIDAAVVDLSEGGMQLRVAMPLKEGERLQLTVSLPGDADPEPLRVQLRAVSQQPLGAAYRVNAEYVGISLLERLRIARFVARESARRSAAAAA